MAVRTGGRLAAEPTPVWDEPRTITSEPSRRGHVDAQRYHVLPDVHVTVFSDGRVRVTSYLRQFRVSELSNRAEGASFVVETVPIAGTEVPE